MNLFIKVVQQNCERIFLLCQQKLFLSKKEAQYDDHSSKKGENGTENQNVYKRGLLYLSCDEMKQKKCCRCNKVKSLNEFYKNKSKNGLSSACKECENKYSIKYREKLKRREKIEIPRKKKCYICGKIKPSNEFYRCRTHKDGLTHRCKKCAKEYWKDYRRKNPHYSKKWLRKIKKEAVDILGGKCKKCGYNKCIGALEFHSCDDKIPDEHHQWGNSRKGCKKLIQLCTEKKMMLLCANCHRELHYYGGEKSS